jgi:O-antigen/teichoic acid export membrane protein
LNYVMSFLFQRMDIFLIGILLGTAEVAFYEMARKIPDALTDLYGAFLGVYLPFASELADTGLNRKLTTVISSTARYTAFGTAWGALIAVAFGRTIIRLLFSDTYLPSVPVFWVLMVALVFLLIDSALGYALVAIGETNKPPINNLVRTFVSFACYFLLIPLLGPVGAALAGLIGLAAVNPLNVLFLHRKKVKVRVVAYLKPIALLGVFLLALLVPDLSDFLRIIIVLVMFPVASALLSVITARDIGAISGAAQVTALKIRSRLRANRGDAA